MIILIFKDTYELGCPLNVIVTSDVTLCYVLNDTEPEVSR